MATPNDTPKPIDLISADAAWTLRMSLMARYDRIIHLYSRDTHLADRLQYLEKLTFLCSELGIDSEEIFSQESQEPAV